MESSGSVRVNLLNNAGGGFATVHHFPEGTLVVEAIRSIEDLKELDIDKLMIRVNGEPVVADQKLEHDSTVVIVPLKQEGNQEDGPNPETPEAEETQGAAEAGEGDILVPPEQGETAAPDEAQSEPEEAGGDDAAGGDAGDADGGDVQEGTQPEETPASE
jgi:hypothetical protein